MHKLKFSFGAAGLQTQLQCLRARNQSFCTLSQQTISLSKNGMIRLQGSNIHHKLCDQYKAIQKVCGKLYKALGTICECHEQHSFYVRLHTEYDLKTIKTHFRLGLHSGLQQSPRWLCIDSISVVPTMDSVVEPSIAPGLIDQRKICDWLEQHFKDDQRSVHGCLGYLESDSEYRHLLYFAPEQSKASISSTISLAHFLSPEVRTSHSGTLSLFQKVRLARQLSMAVLHYHSTPVMRLPWASKDIVFFGSEPDLSSDLRRSSLGEPHLNVQIHNSEIAISLSAAEKALIPNLHLFGLAVVLLELANQAPLREPSINNEGTTADGAHLENYILADVLS